LLIEEKKTNPYFDEAGFNPLVQKPHSAWMQNGSYEAHGCASAARGQEARSCHGCIHSGFCKGGLEAALLDTYL